MNTQTSSQVAATIKKQIGVWPLAEVGARGFLRDEKSLYFDAKPVHRIVRVKIWLTPADLYTLEVFNKKTGVVLHREENLYAEDLAGAVRNLAKSL